MPHCAHCRKADADPDSIGWLGLLPLLVGGTPIPSGRYCRDCAAGMLVPWLLLSAGLAVACFVLMVIL